MVINARISFYLKFKNRSRYVFKMCFGVLAESRKVKMLLLVYSVSAFRFNLSAFSLKPYICLEVKIG